MTNKEIGFYIEDFIKYKYKKLPTKINYISISTISENIYSVSFNDEYELDQVRYFLLSDMVLWLRQIKLEKIIKNIKK